MPTWPWVTQHVVVAGDDAKIWGLLGGQRVFVSAHGGIGVGLVATGQMAATRAFLGGLGHARQVCFARGGGAFDDPGGDVFNRWVKGHCASPRLPPM